MRSNSRGLALTRGQFLKLAAGAGMVAALPARAADAMNAKPIPKSKTGERLPVIGLGTAQDFGAHSSDANMAAKMQVVKELLDGGGAVLDTAASYQNAEEISGQFLEKLGLRKKAFLSTKFGERGKEAGIASIERSFKLLRTDVIDLMYIHNMIDVDTHIPTLKDYKAQGRIRYVGVTSTGGNQDNLATWLKDLDFIQFAYSVDKRDAEKKLLPVAQDAGVATFAALPFGRNRLLSAMKGKEVPEWARKELNCQTYAQLALKYLISHPALTVAIPGTENPKHMAENLEAGRGPLADAKQRERIAALWS
jgi:aryl-alcohol dehydrogenase-like predicted oxidoreductase